MTMDIKELDGKYRVSTVSDYHGPVPMKSDGVTEIKDGKTHRIDAAGCKWTSTFTFLNEDEVQFESTADPSEASSDFLLTNARGELTEDPVTYTTTLKVTRKGDKIRLSGNIQNGNTLTVITMTRE